MILAAEAANDPTLVSNIVSILTAIGGLSSLIGMYWFRKKILAEANRTNSEATENEAQAKQITTEAYKAGVDTALASLQAAVKGAEERADRLTLRLAAAEEEAARFKALLAEERAAFNKERELHEIRMGQLYMEIRRKDEIIAQLGPK